MNAALEKTLSWKTIAYSIMWWVIVCLVVPVVMFSSFGHGSIFYIQPVWFLAATGSISQCLLFINYKGNGLVTRLSIVVIVSSILAAACMAIAWSEPVFSIFDEKHRDVFITIVPFSVVLSVIVSVFVINKNVSETTNA